MVITTPQTVCYRDAIAGMTHKVAPLHHDHEVSGHFSSNITPLQTTKTARTLGSWEVRVYFMHMKEADLLSLNMSS